MRVEQEKRRQRDPWEDIIASLLKDKRVQERGISVAQALAALEIDSGRSTKADAMRAARCFKALGWRLDGRATVAGKRVKLYRPR
jgi:hypothetical protein